jgi:hypothetical protein
MPTSSWHSSTRFAAFSTAAQSALIKGRKIIDLYREADADGTELRNGTDDDPPLTEQTGFTLTGRLR